MRVASKSVRCRWVLDLALSTPGFAGVMAYALREALWLARERRGRRADGLPERRSRRAGRACRRPDALAAITLMVDDVEQLELLPRRRPVPRVPRRRCVAADRPRAPRRAALAAAHAGRRGRARPCRRAARAAASSASCSTRRRSPGCPTRRRRCGWSSAARRPSWPPGAARVVRRGRARSSAPLEFVNSGGTGSLEVSSADAVCHRGHRRVRALRADPVRPLPRLRAASGAVLRAAGGAPSGAAASRRCSAAVTSPPDRPARPGCRAGRRRADADRHRGRGRGADAGARCRRAEPCRSATGCGSGPPRPASCWNGSTPSTRRRHGCRVRADLPRRGQDLRLIWSSPS